MSGGSAGAPTATVGGQRQGAFSRTSADINLGGGGGESVSEVLKSTRKVEIDELVHISLFRSYKVACLGTRDVAVYSYH